MWTVPKFGRGIAWIASSDSELSLEAAYTRTATAVLVGLFAPPMLGLPYDRLQWQAWGSLALVAPLIALSQAASRRSFTLAASVGLVGSVLGAAAAHLQGIDGLGDWFVIVPIETAIILGAGYSNFGGLSPLVLLFALAIAERIGLGGARPEAMRALIFAPPAAVCLSLVARAVDRTWRARLRRKWLRHQSDAASSREMYLWLDGRGRVIEVGTDLADALQVDFQRISGQALLHRIHASDRKEFMRTFEHVLSSDAVDSTAARMRTGEVEGDAGEPRYVYFEARMRRLVGGASANSAAVVVALRDITDAKEAERRLETLRNEAAAAISMKDRLLANVSHELRTPLNAILGFSEMLADPALAPSTVEQRSEYARIIHTSARHLLSVVNLLLDMSKLEAGRYEIEPEPFLLGPLVRNCVDMLRLMAEEREIVIDAAAAETTQEIIADKRACQQILLNLLSNAVKFTPPRGHVTVEVEIVAEHLEIRVSDTGIGISAEHLPRLGDPFFQARSGYDRTAEGSGLGLAMVRGLVGLHGGSVAIESAPGAGTRVAVRLPLDGRAAPQIGGASPKIEVVVGSAWRRPASRPHVSEERKIA